MKIYPQPIYDLDELARYNLHIHTAFSACAQPEMTAKAIVKTAEKAGLVQIALTDHYDHFDRDKDYLAQMDALKAACAEMHPKIKVLFGFELSCYGVGKFLEKDETNQALDYRLVSCNHYDRPWWDKPEDKSPRGCAVHTMRIVKSALESKRYDCVAHPLIGRFCRHLEDRTEVTKAMTDNELDEICELAAKTETALELNTGAVRGDPALFHRLWNLGREVGTIFHYGTDAHSLGYIDTGRYLPEIKKILA
jgi:HisJ family histidinol phosphate phosphatase